MFAYGVCAGPSERYARILEPSLRAHGLGPVVLRRDQSSIFSAYNEILDESVRRWPDLEGVVLVHEDVRIRDSHLEETLRSALAAGDVGLVGVVGGRGHREMTWWSADERHGHVEHAAGRDNFSHGLHDVDTVDGLLMTVSADVARECRLDGRGYPGFHGYDSELCALVRAGDRRVVVADLDVFHDDKVIDWREPQPEVWWAAHEWALRWRDASPPARALRRARRLRLVLSARQRRAWARRRAPGRRR